MKKLIATILVLVLALTMVACGEEKLSGEQVADALNAAKRQTQKVDQFTGELSGVITFDDKAISLHEVVSFAGKMQYKKFASGGHLVFGDSVGFVVSHEDVKSTIYQYYDGTYLYTDLGLDEISSEANKIKMPVTMVVAKDGMPAYQYLDMVSMYGLKSATTIVTSKEDGLTTYEITTPEIKHPAFGALMEIKDVKYKIYIDADGNIAKDYIQMKMYMTIENSSSSISYKMQTAYDYTMEVNLTEPTEEELSEYVLSPSLEQLQQL